MNALPSWYVDGRKTIESFYKPQNLIFESDPIVSWSFSKRYCLIVERYGAEDTQYTRGKIYFSRTQTLIADIKRNHNTFLFAWVTQNHHEYLLTGEDSQGYTVVDLENRTTSNYIDDNAEDGMGFRWTKVLPSPDGKLLAVNGLYFPGLTSTVIYDFSKPRHPLPLPKLRVVDTQLHEDFDIIGWTDNRTLEIKTKDTGVFYDAITGIIKRKQH
jgi:hypothetical protein